MREIFINLNFLHSPRLARASLLITMQSRRWPVSLFLILISISLNGCDNQQKKTDLKIRDSLPVEVYDAKSVTTYHQLVVVATLAGVRRSTLKSAMSGIVNEVGFKLGQHIEKGDLLLRLDNAVPQAQVDLAEVQAQNAYATLTHDAILLKVGGISRDEESADREKLNLAKANLYQARQILKETEIRAPFSGVAGERNIVEGAWLNAGDPITELESIDKISVHIAVTQDDAKDIKLGTKFRLDVPGISTPYNGSIDGISGTFDDASHLIAMTGTVANPLGVLKPGMYATASIQTPLDKPVIFIPLEAVQWSTDRTTIWCVGSDGRAHQRKISIGSQNAQYIEALSGLAAGDKVIISGSQKLFEDADLSISRYHPVKNIFLDESYLSTPTFGLQK
ncbi:MAG: efflux RND transporter periplasmic adaptor subunit [Parvibaculaceae bacterium]